MKLRLPCAPGAWLGAALAAVLGTVCVAAQPQADDKKDDPTQPGPEHKLLEGLAGSYAAKVKFYFEPGKPPEESTGVLKRKLLLGGRYVQEDYEGKIGNDSFTGMGLIGFDRGRKRFIITWIDSMSTGFMTSEGTYDAVTKTFTYRSEDIDPATGMKMKGRDLLRIDNDTQQTFEMYRQPVAEARKNSR